MEENNINKFLSKTKRLDTIKKKARELSILCNVDVCLVGTHQNPDDTSKPASWQTWPEDKNEVARILNKYKKKVDEKEPIDLNKGVTHKKESSKKAIWEFDVDKALEGMSDEELRAVLDRVDEVVGDVDKKLDALSNEQNSGTHTTPMILDLPSNETMEEANIDKFDSEGTHTAPLIVDLEVNREGLDSEVAREGLKLFGVVVIPAMEA